MLYNTTKQIILISIACAIKYLHELNIIYQRIVINNILHDENKCLHLTGLSFFHFDNDSKMKFILGCFYIWNQKLIGSLL